MRNKRPMSLASLPTARNSTISESVSIVSTQILSNDLYNRSSLLKRMRGKRITKMINLTPEMSVQFQRHTVTKIPIHEYKKISQFPFNQLNDRDKRFDIYSSNKKSHRAKQKLLKTKGTTIGGWIGGLFEFIFDGYTGCNNEYRGNLHCQIKYASLNVTTHCINIFYKKFILNDSPYICLCRFRNQSKAKYRDCKFLHANIR